MTTSQQLQDIATIVTIVSGIFTVLGTIVTILTWLIPREKLGKFWHRWRGLILKIAGAITAVSGAILLWRIGWLSWLQAPVTLPVWGLVALSGVLLLVAVGCRRLVKPARREHFGGTLLQRIAFNYSDSPFVHGWQIRGSYDGRQPNFRPIRYRLSGKAIRIESAFKCPIYCELKPAAESGSLIEFVAKYQTPRSIIYARLSVQAQSGCEPKQVWLTFPDKEGAPKPHPRSSIEWEYPVRATRLWGNWKRFRIDLNKAVSQTFGQSDGCVFRGLKGFQLRDSMSLAYISVFERAKTG
jgi:hypothetical protein